MLSDPRIPNGIKMRKTIVLVALLAGIASGFGQTDRRAIVEKLDKHRYRIEQLIMDAENKVIEIPARINMCKGLIEVLLCNPEGKVHESLLVTSVRPLVLQTALITMGYVPENNFSHQAVTADSFSIRVTWGDQSVEVEDLLWNQQGDIAVDDIPWVFVGSPIYPDGQLAAEFEKTLIATYDLSSILANGLKTRMDDTVYIVNEKTVPSKGTSVRLYIQPINKE